jgi:hypothetical protein
MPTDLPPWLTGESDKGFLQGAQLGISAARTGTEIAQTRQQMRESGELQPFRMAAAEIQNNLQRQQVDLNAATFVTKIRAGELENDVKAGLLTSTNLGISLKQLELQDSAIGERAQAEFIAGNREVSPIFKTAQAQSAWRLWKADTDYGHAKANEQAAAKTYETSLVNQAADQLKYGIDPYDYDWEGKRSLLPNVGKLQMGANAMEFKKREAAVRTAQEVGEVSNEFKIQLENAKQSGRLELFQQQLDKRIGDVVNQSKDVNRRIAFQEAIKVARARGDMEEQDRLINEFKGGQTDGETGGAPDSLAKLYSEKKKSYQEAVVAGNKKVADALGMELQRIKVLELKEKGKVIDPDDPDSYKDLQVGEWVVFPANLTSGKMDEREMHVRKFTEESFKALMARHAKPLQDEVEKQVRERKLKSEAVQRSSDAGSAWMRSGRTGGFR